MKSKIGLIICISIAILISVSGVSAITEEYNAINGEDTTEIVHTFNSSDIDDFENSDNDRYTNKGSWPGSSNYEEDEYLLWDDFNISLPECVEINDVNLKFEWKKIGCWNVDKAKIRVKGDTNQWTQVWEETYGLPETSDHIEEISLKDVINASEDLNNLQVKFQAGSSGWGYSSHDWVEVVVDYEECECTQDSDCSSDYYTCNGTNITKHDFYCDLNSYTCEENTSVHEECDNGEWCDGQETCEEINSTAAQCVDGAPVDCSENDLDPIGTCTYDPDNIDFTWDYFAGFTSTCNEEEDRCTTGTVDLTHTCDVDQCGADCDEDSDCECPLDTGCYDRDNDGYEDDYVVYPDYGNCTSNCTCNTDTTPCEGPCKPSSTDYDSSECVTCVDEDGDGYYAMSPECPEGDDCDDTNEYVHPGAEEYCCDGIDNDCDGLIDCEDPDCQGPCDDSDNDGVINPNDECPDTPEGEEVNEEGCSCSQLEGYPEFDDGNECTIDGCEAGNITHEPADSSVVCESTTNEYYTCRNGDVYFITESIEQHCGSYTGECNGPVTESGRSALIDSCGTNEYCVEGSDHCHKEEGVEKEETTPRESVKELPEGPSKGMSDYHIICGDGFCVMPQEMTEENTYYCPEDCSSILG